jgi:ABC-type phosphate transport system substrate-binding protein
MRSLLATAAVCGLIATGAAHAGAIVVGKASPISAMDADTAKRVFLGRDASLDGQSIVVLYQTDGPVRSDFENKVLGKTGADLASYWSKLIFTGRATAPDEVGGDAAVKAKLNANPGAIGYVSDGGIDGSVKVLFKY